MLTLAHVFQNFGEASSDPCISEKLPEHCCSLYAGIQHLLDHCGMTRLVFTATPRLLALKSTRGLEAKDAVPYSIAVNAVSAAAWNASGCT